MGRATMGTVRVNSVSDLHANFGTGAAGSALEREVEPFFGNDGKELIKVRVFGPDPHSSVPSKAAIDLGAFTLEAASESLGGRSMIVSVALPRGSRPLRKQERREGEAFNLEVRVSGTWTSVPAEVHRELTLGDGPRRADRVLEEGSRFVRFRKRGEGMSVS